MGVLKNKEKKLEIQIDDYLNKILTGGLTFRQGIKYYLSDQKDIFENKLEELHTLESTADDLRRTIETRLYMHTLIPEYRGDVLGLLESSDKVLNMLDEILAQFSVESPKFPVEITQLVLDLSDTSVSAVESMVSAVRSYFIEMQLVRDYIIKTMFFEKESDKIADKIKRIIFGNEAVHLSSKVHSGYFIQKIEKIADIAEDVTDRLSIAVIKRYG